jgi:hypothetical protein
MKTKLLFILTFLFFVLAIAAQSFPISSNTSKESSANFVRDTKSRALPSNYSPTQDTVPVYDSIENMRWKPGIKNVKEIKGTMFIYPNPSNGTFTINLENKRPIQNLEVYNVVGERILQQHQSNQVSIPNAQAGIYFVKIDDGIGIYTKKITVQ